MSGPKPRKHGAQAPSGDPPVDMGILRTVIEDKGFLGKAQAEQAWREATEQAEPVDLASDPSPVVGTPYEDVDLPERVGNWIRESMKSDTQKVLRDAVCFFCCGEKGDDNLFSKNGFYRHRWVDSFAQDEALYILLGKELFDREFEIIDHFQDQAAFNAYMDGLHDQLSPRILGVFNGKG